MTAHQIEKAPDPIFSASSKDSRADRGRREIAITGEHVTINRRFQGIEMHLSLALSAYQGVALCLRPGVNDALVYQIRLVHPDTELSVVLDEALDDRNIIADWRLWARALGLSALVEREVGRYEMAEAMPDSCDADAALPRRYRPSKLRPSFLMRRKVGQIDGAPVVHADEREIIARD